MAKQMSYSELREKVRAYPYTASNHDIAKKLKVSWQKVAAIRSWQHSPILSKKAKVAAKKRAGKK